MYVIRENVFDIADGEGTHFETLCANRTVAKNIIESIASDVYKLTSRNDYYTINQEYYDAVDNTTMFDYTDSLGFRHMYSIYKKHVYLSSLEFQEGSDNEQLP